MDPASASIRRARPLLGTFVEIAVAGASTWMPTPGLKVTIPRSMSTVRNLRSYPSRFFDT